MIADYVADVVRKCEKDTIISPEHWDEDNTPFRPILFLHGSTYQPDKVFDLPAFPEQYLVSPRGGFAYQNRIQKKEQPIPMFGHRKGIVFWTDDVVIPGLVDMRRENDTGDFFDPDLSEKFRFERGAVWMSLTPSEMLSQRSGVQAAEGTVVIGGLGLGWFLRKVCEKPEVEKVIVVEKSQELLDWYGHRVCKQYPKVADVICDDIYNHTGKHGDAMYLLDIWPIFQGARNDPQYRSAKRKLKRRLWAWGIN